MNAPLPSTWVDARAPALRTPPAHAVWIRRGRRWTRRLRERLGTLGQIGVALLLAAAALVAYAPQLARQTEALHAQAQRTRGQLDDVRQRLAQRPSSPPQAAQLRAWFPTIDRATADVRVLFAAARKNRIDLGKGEYTLVRAEDASGLQRFEVVLPVKERYGAIKGFVADVLNEIPHASLAELRIERGAASVDVLDARVHFTLFYRES
jgi:hypothetical protein